MGCRAVAAKMLSSSAHAGDPVRRGFSVQSLASLEYWVARSSRAMTPVVEDTPSPSRGTLRPRFAGYFLAPFKSEGAGNAGCALHPRSHAQGARKVRA